MNANFPFHLSIIKIWNLKKELAACACLHIFVGPNRSFKFTIIKNIPTWTFIDFYRNGIGTFWCSITFELKGMGGSGGAEATRNWKDSTTSIVGPEQKKAFNCFFCICLVSVNLVFLANKLVASKWKWLRIYAWNWQAWL